MGNRSCQLSDHCKLIHIYHFTDLFIRSEKTLDYKNKSNKCQIKRREIGQIKKVSRNMTAVARMAIYK